MRPFTYERPERAADAARLASNDGARRVSAPREGAVLYAGGTTMLDLMKLDVAAPERLVDVTRLTDPGLREIRVESGAGGPDTLHLGALVTMHEAAEHAGVKSRAPVLSESLWLAASQQLRHMATLGGNVMQRTRCPYYRDPSWAACNKRDPGSGCAARGGVNRLHAVLGTSEACAATYPGDWAQALVAFDATVDVTGPSGERTLPFAELHRLPGDTPELETNLGPGELITGYAVPLVPALARSIYIKARDRESYAFANASAAAGLELEDDGETVKEVRLGLGGVATVPWRAREAEEVLRGQALTEALARRAGEAAFANAEPLEHNGFKPALGANVIVKALMALKSLEA